MFTSALGQIGEMLSSSVGTFVYYLVVLLAVEAALGMAWSEWQRSRSDQARRFLQAMAGLTLLRLSYAIAALTISTLGSSPTALLPPLERFVDAASICLLGWAFVHPGRREARAWDVTLAVSLVLALAAGVWSTIAWGSQALGEPTLDYATSWQAVAWSLGQLALIVLASLAVARNRAEGRSAFLVAMLALFLGCLGQIVYPPAVPNLPTWERLSSLVAYPLVAVAVYQAIFTGLRDNTRQLQDISQASLDQIKSLLLLFDACQQISASLNLSTVLDNAVQGIARVLEADQCAVAFPDNGDPGYMRLAAIYGLTRQGRGEAPTFPLEYQLTVQQALRRKKYVTVEESENVQLRVLFNLLGSSEAGPLLVQPLLLDGEAIGAILVGNSRSRRPFSPHEAILCQSLANQVVSAIQNARRFAGAQERIKELHRSLDEKRRPVQLTAGHTREPGDQAEVEASSASGDSLWRVA